MKKAQREVMTTAKRLLRRELLLKAARVFAEAEPTREQLLRLQKILRDRKFMGMCGTIEIWRLFKSRYNPLATELQGRI